MAIEILDGNTLVRSIPHVLTASLCDKLDGTLTFDFTAPQKGESPILPIVGLTCSPPLTGILYFEIPHLWMCVIFAP